MVLSYSPPLPPCVTIFGTPALDWRVSRDDGEGDLISARYHHRVWCAKWGNCLLKGPTTQRCELKSHEAKELEEEVEGPEII